MSQAIWISVSTVGVFALAALVTMDDGGVTPDAEAARLAMTETRIVPAEGGGNALAAAAFGLDALQPETYDQELVLHLIEASPLEPNHKVQLTEELEAAASGEVGLDGALRAVRLALSVE